jgi:dihydroorotate dehydrogenase
MWLSEDAPIRKWDLHLAKPFVNSTGSLGFTPDSHSMPFLSQLGAFITHPISRFPRNPAGNRACIPYQGGFLLHTGLPNPGINRGKIRYRQRWAGAPVPIIVHLLVETPETLTDMVRSLEGLENILALELGLPPDAAPSTLPAIMDAASGELPVIPCISPDQVSNYLEVVVDLQPAALHLTSPRGSLPGPNGENISGRLYGPAIFPQMLLTAQTLIKTGIPVIADGGIFHAWQASALLDAGVMAVGLDAALWGIDWEGLFHGG